MKEFIEKHKKILLLLLNGIYFAGLFLIVLFINYIKNNRTLYEGSFVAVLPGILLIVFFVIILLLAKVIAGKPKYKVYETEKHKSYKKTIVYTLGQWQTNTTETRFEEIKKMIFKENYATKQDTISQGEELLAFIENRATYEREYIALYKTKDFSNGKMRDMLVQFLNSTGPYSKLKVTGIPLLICVDKFNDSLKEMIKNYKFDAYAPAPIQIPIGISFEENEMRIPYYDKEEKGYTIYINYINNILKALKPIIVYEEKMEE